MKKKILLLIVAASLTMSVFAGCNGTTDENGSVDVVEPAKENGEASNENHPFSDNTYKVVELNKFSATVETGEIVFDENSNQVIVPIKYVNNMESDVKVKLVKYDAYHSECDYEVVVPADCEDFSDTVIIELTKQTSFKDITCSMTIGLYDKSRYSRLLISTGCALNQDGVEDKLDSPEDCYMVASNEGTNSFLGNEASEEFVEIGNDTMGTMKAPGTDWKAEIEEQNHFMYKAGDIAIDAEKSEGEAEDAFNFLVANFAHGFDAEGQISVDNYEAYYGYITYATGERSLYVVFSDENTDGVITLLISDERTIEDSQIDNEESITRRDMEFEALVNELLSTYTFGQYELYDIQF